MTVLYDQGDAVIGDRIVAYARRIEAMRAPIAQTHRHRAQVAKLDDAEWIAWKAACNARPKLQAFGVGPSQVSTTPALRKADKSTKRI